MKSDARKDAEPARRLVVGPSANASGCVWRSSSTAHVPEGRQPGNEGIRPSALAYTVPTSEPLFRKVHLIEHFLPRAQVGVSCVAVASRW